MAFYVTLTTICTILKQKDAIKAIKPTKGVTILSKMRTDIHDEMERLLLLWIRDKELAGDTVTESIVSEKALSIYKDLQREAASTEGETSSGTRGVDFKARPPSARPSSKHVCFPPYRPDPALLCCVVFITFISFLWLFM